MAKYVIKRIFAMIPTLFIVSIVVFYMLRLPNVDEVSVIIGGRTATEELKASVTEEYHLDDPLLIQYITWMKGVLQGDFGKAYSSGQPVGDLIEARIPVTLGLVIFSTVVGFLLAVLLGTMAALHRNKPLDTGISLIMLFFGSVPGFLQAILVLIFVARFFPGYSFISTYSNFSEYVQRLSIPSVIMALGQVALLGRVTRNSMTKELSSPYIMTARAKGIRKGRMIFRHAFKNAVIPVLTIAGMGVASLIGEAVLVEQIFSLPGIGSLLVTAVEGYDFPVVQILVLLLLLIYMIVSLLLDILYVLLDPRVKLQ